MLLYAHLYLYTRNILSSVYIKLDIPETRGINMRVAAINKARDLGLLPLD
jgi:hypothetical protein